MHRGSRQQDVRSGIPKTPAGADSGPGGSYGRLPSQHQKTERRCQDIHADGIDRRRHHQLEVAQHGQRDNNIQQTVRYSRD
jgi:hypothetical protein